MSTENIRMLARVRAISVVCHRFPVQRGRLVRAFALLEKVSARSPMLRAK